MGKNGGGETGQRDSGSFEERLQAARLKQGLDPQPGVSITGSAPIQSDLGIGLRVGLELVSSLVVAVAIGWWLDKWLHSSPVFLAVFVLLGGAAGIANVWRLMGPGRQVPDDRQNVVTGRPIDGPGGKGRDSGG